MQILTNLNHLLKARSTRLKKIILSIHTRNIFFITASIASALLVTNRNPVWFFTGRGEIDPWFYWGTGEIFEYTGEHFHQTYYFRRWTLTFPNFLFQNALPPFEAQFALRHLILIAVLFLSASLVYTLTKSLASASFAILAISSSTYFISPIGQTYHEGTGLVFFLLLLLILIHVLDSSHASRHWLFIGGVVFGLFLITYQYALFWFFAMGVAAFVVWGRKWFANLRSHVFPFIFGFAVIDVLDFAIGLWFGYWPELVTYTLGTGEGIRESGAFAPDIQKFVSVFLLKESNFIFPLLFLGLVGLLGLPSASIKLKWFSYFMLSLGSVYFILPFLGIYGPEILHTAIYGMLVSLLGAFVAASRAIDHLFSTPKSLVLIEGVKFLVFGLCFVLASVLPGELWLPLMAASLISIFLYFMSGKLLWLPLASHRRRFLMFASVLTVFVAFLAQGLPYFSYSEAEARQVTQNARAKMTTLSVEVRALSGFALENQYRIFILDNRPHERWSETISAFYGMYSSISEGYPAPPVDCNRLAYAVSRENPRFILIHEGDAASSSDFLTEYLSPCSQYAPVFEGEVPGVNASVFKLIPKLGP